MRNNDVINRIKAFGMTNQMLSEEFSKIERDFQLELGHLPRSIQEVEQDYYPQLDAEIRKEGARMARHYEVFYSLERAIRNLVDENIATEVKNSDWWDGDKVPESIKFEVAQRIKKEIDAGVSRRSQNELDYTTFGELSVIITSNWALFGSIFNSKKSARENPLKFKHTKKFNSPLLPSG